MTDTQNLRVVNEGSHAVYVPGGELEPGKLVSRPESEQLRELLDNKIIREAGDFSGYDLERLAAEVEARGLEVKGTGSDGNVIRADYEKALEADERKGK